MHKTTIMLPIELKILAEKEAHRLGISLGEVIRMALKEFTRRTPSKKQRDPLFSTDLVYDGPCESDLSINHDDYLYGIRK